MRHAGTACRLIGTVVDLAALDDRNLRVEQSDKRANQPRLCLTPLAQQNNVLAGDNSVFDLRQNRILIADDPREKFLAGTDARHEVLAKLILHVQDGVLALPQFSNRPRLGHSQPPRLVVRARLSWRDAFSHCPFAVRACQFGINPAYY